MLNTYNSYYYLHKKLQEFENNPNKQVHLKNNILLTKVKYLELEVLKH